MAIAVITRASGGLPVKDLGGPGGMAVTEVAPALGGLAITKVVGAGAGMGVTFVSSTGGPALIPTTWNSADKSGTTMVLTNSNLTATASAGGSGVEGVRGVTGFSTGKYYFECTMTAWTSVSTGVGIAKRSISVSTAIIAVGVSGIVRNNGNIYVNNVNVGTLGARANGNIIGIACNFDTPLIWFRVAPSGNWNNSGTADPATGVGGFNITSILTEALSPFFRTAAQNDNCTANFGASAFVGAVPSGFTAGWPA